MIAIIEIEEIPEEEELMARNEEFNVSTVA
jgi:hypothetical protein